MHNFGRLITAMASPMKPDGDIDLDMTKNLAQKLVQSGTESIVSTGTTGESPTLSSAEQIAIWKTTKNAVGKSIPVIAGATNNNTAESIKLCQEAENAGLDGLLLTVPAYNKPTQQGLIEHFTTIAKSTSLPCLLYNVPSRTALNMESTTTLELAKIPNVIGIKEASGDLNQIKKIIDQAPTNFYVWSGNDSDTLPIMRIGGVGIVSVASHLIGSQISQMIDLQITGATSEAEKVNARIMPLCNVLFSETSPTPLKYALDKIGFSIGPTRMPLIQISNENAILVENELHKQKIDLPV